METSGLSALRRLASVSLPIEEPLPCHPAWCWRLCLSLVWQQRQQVGVLKAEAVVQWVYLVSHCSSPSSSSPWARSLRRHPTGWCHSGEHSSSSVPLRAWSLGRYLALLHSLDCFSWHTSSPSFSCSLATAISAIRVTYENCSGDSFGPSCLNCHNFAVWRCFKSKLAELKKLLLGRSNHFCIHSGSRSSPCLSSSSSPVSSQFGSLS